jgi:hypothetical protein
MNTQLIQQIAEEQILQIFIDVQAELARKIDELYLDDYQSDRLTESIAMVHENNKQKYLRGLATTGELPATVSKGYTSGFEEGFNEGRRKGELPAGPAIDLEHFLDYVGLNYTPVKFNDGVCWDLDDSEAPVSSEEVIQDYEEQFGSTPVAPKEEGDPLVPGSRNTDVEPVASHSSTSGYSDKQFSAKPFPTPAEAFKYKRQIECLNALRTLNPLLSPVERRVIKDKVIAKYGSDLLNSEPDPTTERSNDAQ